MLSPAIIMGHVFLVEWNQQLIMHSFAFEAKIPRTVFGSGTLAQVAVEVDKLGAQHVLIVTEKTARQLALAEKVRSLIALKFAGMYVLSPLVFERY